MKRMKTLATIALAGLCVLGVTGCSEGKPIVESNRSVRTFSDSLDEQRKWIGEQFDDAIAASGVTEGWFDIYNHDVLWAEDRQIDRYKILGSLFPRGCGLTGGQLSESLKNFTIEEPMVAADRVRAHWEAAGWKISDIRPYVEGQSTYFRADRDDGAELAFGVTPDNVWVEAATRCSAHGTVSFPKYEKNEESFHVKRLRELQDEAGIPWGDELQKWKESRPYSGLTNETSTDSPNP